MKKIFSLLVAIACMVTFAQAQTGVKPSKKDAVKKETVKKPVPPKAPAKTAKAPKAVPPKAVAKPASAPSSQHVKKNGTPDKRYKENQHLKKDGTPDKRYKASKPAAKKN